MKLRAFISSALIATMMAIPTQAQESKGESSERFLSDWAELNKRELPAWFNEDKFGIFVVWGPYSVPSYINEGYAEWYWRRLLFKVPEVVKFHKENFGDRAFEDLVNDFKAELFDPDEWCDIFKRSGARYVVTTSNFHDGFTMYPTEYSETSATKIWSSTEVGPMRDIIGELNEAGDKVGLKMGFYYSLYEWYHPMWLSDPKRFATEWMTPKFKEVVTKYKPWSIFLDGEWGMANEEDWKSNELARWLYTESPVKDRVVVNDRWGKSRGVNGDVFESEYGNGKWTSPEHPWQEDCGIGNSYGYNRKESIDDYRSTEELVQLLSNVASGGGNLLLCVGPTSDGRIPVIMQDRLLGIGEWLKHYGDAIYGTSANPFWPRTFDWGSITTKGDKVYLHIHNPQVDNLTIEGFNNTISSAKLLRKGESYDIKAKVKKGGLSIEWDAVYNDEAVTIIELTKSSDNAVDKRQYQYSDGRIYLTGRAFTPHNTALRPLYTGYHNLFKLTEWSERDGYINTDIYIKEPGKYSVEMAYMTTLPEKAGSDVVVEINDCTLKHKTVESLEDKSTHLIPTHDIGSVTFDTSGFYTIKIKVDQGGDWHGLGLQTVCLKPIK